MTTKADLVEQQTATTGTGTYTVAGSVVGRQTFATALADGDVVPCVITDDGANFEAGFYTWAETAGTLARTAITASSNAGAAVNWAAGNKRVYLSEHAACSLAGVRHNLNAADNTPPTNTDNAALGYGKGSLWATNDTSSQRTRLFVLGAFSGSDAFWQELLQLYNPDADGSAYVSIGTVGSKNSVLFGLLGLFSARGPYFNQGNAGFNLGLGAYSGTLTSSADCFLTGGSANTSDATPTKLALDGDAATHKAIRLTDGSVASLTGTVTARCDNGDHASWSFTIVASCVSTTVTFNVNTFTSLYASAGASGWAATAVVDDTDGLAIQATGEAASNIVWSAAITGSFVNQS